MSDPITTILTTAAEHAPSAAAVTVVLKAAKNFLAKVAGPAVEELGEIGRDYVKGWRAKNGNAVLAEADKLLTEAGREPQAVPLKTLLPLLDAASLEDEPALAEKWAALLANAADILSEVEVVPAYAEILKQLTAPEAKLLDMLFAEAISVFSPPIDGEFSDHFKQPAMRKAWALDKEIDVSHISYKLRSKHRSDFDTQALEERNKFQAMIDNLLRQRVIVAAKEETIKAGESFVSKPAGVSKAYMTSLGYDFMLAVIPPRP